MNLLCKVCDVLPGNVGANRECQQERADDGSFSGIHFACCFNSVEVASLPSSLESKSLNRLVSGHITPLGFPNVFFQGDRSVPIPVPILEELF